MSMRRTRKYGLVLLAVIAVALGAVMNKERFVVYSLKSKFAPLNSFEDYDMPEKPDYSDRSFWAAFPGVEDNADVAPAITGFENNQENAEVDVFYVHPTTFLNKAEGWTANAKSDILLGPFDPLRFQASVFNGSARIYAPRYRQATLFSFFDDSGEGKKALGVAQQDIIDAFIYYLAHYNNERPFILAGHSQGSMMLIPVLRYLERYPTDKFITAYVPGWSISTGDLETMKPCDSPTALGCFNVWNSKRWGSNIDSFVTPSRYLGSDCVNPLSWKNDEVAVPETEHLGAIDIIATAVDKQYVKAKCEGEMLWVDLPDDPRYQSKLDKDNYHIVDFGLFYFNIRENVKQRIAAYKARE